MTRDYVGDMRAIINEETSHGPYVSRVTATRIVNRLRSDDPSLLRSWLDAQAETIIWQAINDRDRSLRAYARQHAGRSVFRHALGAHDEGDDTELFRLSDVPYVVNTDGVRKRLADMTAADCRYAADGYERREKENAMEKAFLRALAKKVGRNGTVGEHLTEDQICAIRESFRLD